MSVVTNYLFDRKSCQFFLLFPNESHSIMHVVHIRHSNTLLTIEWISNLDFSRRIVGSMIPLVSSFTLNVKLKFSYTVYVVRYVYTFVIWLLSNTSLFHDNIKKDFLCFQFIYKHFVGIHMTFPLDSFIIHFTSLAIAPRSYFYTRKVAWTV